MNLDPLARARQARTPHRTTVRSGLRFARAVLAVAVAGCGGGSGPTAPAAPAVISGSWSGSATTAVTSGPACLGRQPYSAPAMATIEQSGAAISGTLGTCSFHGTVSGTAISWTQDAQQADPACLAAHLIPCVANSGGISFVDVGGSTTDIAGTVSASHIAASGTTTSNIFDPASGKPTGTIQATVQLALQRK